MSSLKYITVLSGLEQE